MLPKKYKQKPRDFEHFEGITGWDRKKHLVPLLLGEYIPRRLLRATRNPSEYSSDLTRNEATKLIKIMAREYRYWFEREPARTHVFPLVGAFVQYEFARGVADACGLNPRIRTMVTSPSKAAGSLQKSGAKKLRLNETGVVVHDSKTKGFTISNIADAADLNPREIPVHELSLSQTKPRARVPLFNGEKWVTAFTTGIHRADIRGSLISKEYGEDGVKLTSPRYDGNPLTEREKELFRRNAYSAGIAAAKELMKDEANSKRSP